MKMKVICPKECKERIAKGENVEIDVRENYEYEHCNIGSFIFQCLKSYKDTLS